MPACVGEPISWPRLETYALDRRDPAIAEHVATCPACRQCLDEIEHDVVALPGLPVLAPRPARRWWWLAAPALAAAAAIALLVLRPGEPAPAFSRTASIKGVGDVVLGVVRDRDGTIRDDVTTFAPGDRWKVVVTCDPATAAWIDVAVVEDGATRADHPLAPAHVACGNAVVVPGAFELTGSKPNRVCVRVAAQAAPRRALPAPGEHDVACVTIRPE
jgi:hypothetical protein